MRELEADRPDATESPITVDGGRWQVESSWISYSRDDVEGTLLETTVYGETNLKYGLSDRMDFQAIFAPHVVADTEGGDRVTGFGDVTLRLKYNLWGNDSGATALAALPYVTIPSRTEVSGSEYEGGVVFPFAWRAGERWSLGAQVEVARVAEDMRHIWDTSVTTVLGLDVTDRVGVYMEYIGNAGDHRFRHFFSGGSTLDVSDWVRLDAGAVVGLNEDSEDLTVFTGVTWKF